MEPGHKQTGKDDQGLRCPSPWAVKADHAWRIMQGRLERGGSFGNGLSHSG
jgi:hypothetical protein